MVARKKPVDFAKLKKDTDGPRPFLVERIEPSPADVLAAQLDAIIERLPRLRALGVTQLQVGDVGFQLEPPAPEPQPRHPGAPDDDFLDPSKYKRAEADLMERDE